MDIILDANAYLQVLQNHGRKFLETNQFVELVTYLRRTGSRLVIPLVTFYEVVERYRIRLMEVAKEAQDAWATLQKVSMTRRSDFPVPDLKGELNALRRLLRHPVPGVRSSIYHDYRGVEIHEVVRRGVKRIRPANDKGEELRDVVLWLIVLEYARQIGQRIAFVSDDDKAFREAGGALHHSLRADIEQAGVDIAFYRSVGDFVKGNALESEVLQRESLANYISTEEVHGISTERLLRSRPREGAIRSVEIASSQLAEAQRYRVADDSYYVEAHFTGEGVLKVSVIVWQSLPLESVTLAVPWQLNPFVANRAFGNWSSPRSATQVAFPPTGGLWGTWEKGFNATFGEGRSFVPEETETTYSCNFDLRLSLRIVGGRRESLEVDSFQLRNLTPVIASTQ